MPRSRLWEGLVGVVEIAVVEVVANWQAGDVAGWEVLWISLPLLCGVVADECLVKWATNEGNGLFFEVGGVGGIDFCRLFLDELTGFIWL